MNYNEYTRSEPSLGDLFSDLSNQAGELVRQEIRLAQAEMTRKATRAARSAATVAAGGVVALGGFLALVAALILALAQVMDAWLAALLVGVVLAAAGGLMARAGLEKLKAIDPAPRRTIQTMRENKEWLADQI